MERDGYVPFKLGLYAKSKDSEITYTIHNLDFYSLLKIGDYILASHIINNTKKYNDKEDEKNVTSTTIDNNGVIIKTEKTNGDYTISIKNKNGKKLGDFDEKTKTITYSDGTSETLY